MAAPRGWLIDTNVISELRKGERANPAMLSWAKEVAPLACFVSVVTIAEIRFGIERVQDMSFRIELELWLKHGVRVWFGERILPADEAVLTRWRQLAAEGQRAGYTYSQPDALIAATALVHDLAVVTRNTADFRRAGVTLVDPWERTA